MEAIEHVGMKTVQIGCFKNNKMPQQYAPLQGAHKPDPKIFFYRTSLEGLTT